MTKKRFRGKAHVDQEKAQLKKDAETVIRYGTVEEFKEILRKAGKDPDSPEGRKLIDRLIALGAGGRPRQ